MISFKFLTKYLKFMHSIQVTINFIQSISHSITNFNDFILHFLHFITHPHQHYSHHPHQHYSHLIHHFSFIHFNYSLLKQYFQLQHSNPIFYPTTFEYHPIQIIILDNLLH